MFKLMTESPDWGQDISLQLCETLLLPDSVLLGQGFGRRLPGTKQPQPWECAAFLECITLLMKHLLKKKTVTRLCRLTKLRSYESHREEQLPWGVGPTAPGPTLRC